MSVMLADLRLLRSLFALDTSELPKTWVPERPSTGHCHVASLIVQRRYGGRILRGLAHSYFYRSIVHYWSDFDGIFVDLTFDQFPEGTWVTGITDATDEELNPTTIAKLELLEERFRAAQRLSRL